MILEVSPILILYAFIIETHGINITGDQVFVQEGYQDWHNGTFSKFTRVVKLTTEEIQDHDIFVNNS